MTDRRRNRQTKYTKLLTVFPLSGSLTRTLTVRILFSSCNISPFFFSSDFSGIDRFTVQGFETPQEVKENEQLTFICITQCNPKPNIMLKTKNDEVAELRNGDRITFTETTSGIWEYRLEVAAVSCADTGNYTCYAENLITATHLTKTSEIIVRCKQSSFLFSSNFSLFFFIFPSMS